MVSAALQVTGIVSERFYALALPSLELLAPLTAKRSVLRISGARQKPVHETIHDTIHDTIPDRSLDKIFVGVSITTPNGTIIEAPFFHNVAVTGPDVGASQSYLHP